jgi:hypothetical protein
VNAMSALRATISTRSPSAHSAGPNRQMQHPARGSPLVERAGRSVVLEMHDQHARLPGAFHQVGHLGEEPSSRRHRAVTGEEA